MTDRQVTIIACIDEVIDLIRPYQGINRDMARGIALLEGAKILIKLDKPKNERGV